MVSTPNVPQSGTPEGGLALTQDRTGLTFAQAEGAEPLPQQLQRDQVSKKLRSRMWDAFLQFSSHNALNGRLSQSWSSILRYIHVNHFLKPSDEFDNKLFVLSLTIKPVLLSQDYIAFYGLLQEVIRHPQCPTHFITTTRVVLEQEHASFRLVEKTMLPFSSQQEADNFRSAIDLSKLHGQVGAHRHLLDAGNALSNGLYADSVTESINAVEAVCRTIAGDKAKLSQALAVLELKGTIHTSLKKALTALYGYTSDEPGLRHCLMLKGESNVDEADAMMMLGVCSSFVTYVLTRSQESK